MSAIERMPPTPRRRSVGNPRPPPQTFLDPASYFKLPSFLLGMFCSLILLLAGFSLTPHVGHVGVSGVTAATPRAVLDHMNTREACGLPSIDNFRCEDGIFMGQNQPITDLECDIHLYATDGAPPRHPLKRIRLMNSSENEQVQEMHDILKSAAGPFTMTSAILFIRWMDDMESAVTSFSLHDSILYPHLPNKELKDRHEDVDPLSQSTLRWVKNRNNGLHGELQSARFIVFERLELLNPEHYLQPYLSKLQYMCIGNEPTLALSPADGCEFSTLPI